MVQSEIVEDVLSTISLFPSIYLYCPVNPHSPPQFQLLREGIVQKQQ